MDYTYIFLLMIFILWLYFIELSLTRKERGYNYLQFVLSFPLMVFLANNSYLEGFVFGYVFVLSVGIASIYILATNMLEFKKIDKK